jgi:hypothetical protein
LNKYLSGEIQEGIIPSNTCLTATKMIFFQQILVWLNLRRHYSVKYLPGGDQDDIFSINTCLEKFRKALFRQIRAWQRPR